MLQGSVRDRVATTIRSGRYSLLLGAGFSMSSTSADGRGLPRSSDLERELMRQFSLPEHPLAQLTAAIPGDDLNTYFQRRFKGCIPSTAVRTVSSFVWRGIYTFNVDDLLETAYAHANPMQRLRWVTHRDRYEVVDDLGDVIAVHLHGCVLRPNDGYVFSVQDYGQSIAEDTVWFHILADLIATQPFIVLGCSLAEPDLEYYFARRRGISATSQTIAPSLFITPNLDRVKTATCERWGLIPIETSSDEFLQWLAAETSPRPKPLDLLVPREALDLFREAPAQRSLRVFFRQWIHVDKQTLPAPVSSAPLLRGIEPNWEHIKSRQDVLRSDVVELVREISSWYRNPQHSTTREVILSAAGEGKSTALLRICFELAESGVVTFYFGCHERLVPEASAEALTKLKAPIVLVVDQLAEHVHQVSDVLGALTEHGRSYFLLGAERHQRARRIEAGLGTSTWRSHKLHALDASESLELATKLRSQGLLGRSASLTDNKLAKRMRDRQLIAAVISAGGPSTRFAEIIESEFDSLADSNSQKLYLLVSIAHRCGYPVKHVIAGRALGLTTAQVMPLLGGPLNEIVMALPPMGEYIETRHRVVAEWVTRHTDRERVLESAVRLARGLAPYVNRQTIMRGIPEAKLSGRLLDFDDTIGQMLGDRSREFYDDIKPEWGWNSRYWEQRALMELQGAPLLAVDYATHAVGIEEHPHTLTTLAKVEFDVARRSGGTESAYDWAVKGLEHAERAIELSRNRSRLEVHPFDVAIRGLMGFYRQMIELGRAARIESTMVARVTELLHASQRHFARREWESLNREWVALRAHLP